MIQFKKPFDLTTLKLLAKIGRLQVPVKGISMLPTIREGDVVTVSTAQKYHPADILLFPYKEEGLLLHRLIKVDSRYFCKGDNAFRLEDISFDEIIGKVTLRKRNGILLPLPYFSKTGVNLSCEISEIFRKHKYDKSKTTQHESYRAFMRYLEDINDEKDTSQ